MEVSYSPTLLFDHAVAFKSTFFDNTSIPHPIHLILQGNIISISALANEDGHEI